MILLLKNYVLFSNFGEGLIKPIFYIIYSVPHILLNNMRKTLNLLHSKVQAICEPNPKLYPDPPTHQIIWNRSVNTFYICFIFNFICIITGGLSSGFSSPADQINVISNFLVLSSFILLCRSYLRVFHIGFTLYTGFIFLRLLDTIPETTYFFLGYMFALPPFILILSGRTTLASFAGILQTYICLTKYKEKLIMMIKEEDPEIFADRFIKTTFYLFVSMLLANLSLLSTLDKRSIDLIRAKNSLEAALENQKTFIFSFSHELRNPINSLLGNLQLVLEGEALSQKAAEMIKVAKICGQILLHGINNVLETGKREIGKLEVNPVPTQIYEMLQRSWGIYGELLRQRKLESKLKIDQALPPLLKIDAHKVNQVLLNLIGNSIKFTERGSISVSCKWLETREVNHDCFEPKPYDEEEEGVFEKDENLLRMKSSKYLKPKSNVFVLKDGKNEKLNMTVVNKPAVVREETPGILKIIVKDTGSGMKKEALEKLFKKFSQVSENISQRQIGTGLGLFITKEICNSMNGQIRVYSKPGIGTTFVVCVPTTALPSDLNQKVDYSSILKRLSEKCLKAIIADDSPFNINLISDYFSKFGGSAVSIAYNGYDAFTKYKNCRSAKGALDVVVLDIDMPVMDGKTACEKIRQYEKDHRLEPVAIILISGNYGKERIDEYIGQGRGQKADCFLKKPVSFNEFSRAVYNCVVKKSSPHNGFGN